MSIPSEMANMGNRSSNGNGQTGHQPRGDFSRSGSEPEIGVTEDWMREYIMAELKTMLATMDERCRSDKEESNRSALLWIEKNATAFREQWNSEKRQQSRPIFVKGIDA